MSKPVIVVGAGGHGKVIADALRAMGAPVLGFVDLDPRKHRDHILGLPVLGDEAALVAYPPTEVQLANGLGSASLDVRRRDAYIRLTTRGYAFITIVHPSAIVARSVRLCGGAQVMAGAVIQADAEIGSDAIINTHASVDHDCRIGAHCHIAPGCTLSGGVIIGDETHLGTGATVIQGLRIGARVLVAAGAVVVNDVSDNARVQGVPAR